MTNTQCPRCGGPADEHRTGPGFPRPGALSRADNKTMVCTSCGHDEAWRDWNSRRDPSAWLPRSEWWDRTG